jgi:hypothetical protein
MNRNARGQDNIERTAAAGNAHERQKRQQPNHPGPAFLTLNRAR